ncbi:hypothetical protein Leryth_002551 [Lithospermum erythrorhizon]|nr:hypothetical protein Leryth_002551 [Lithospermum erythrorhizon]
MVMEEIFQELLLSVGLSVAVCCMILKLKPCGDEEGGEAFKKSYDGIGKAVFSGQKSEEHELSFGSDKNRGVWPFAEFFEQFRVDKLYDTNVIGHGEITSELVDDEGEVLKDLSIEKEIVGGDESSRFSHGKSNVIDDSKVVSEIVEDVDVFEILRRREEHVDGCSERLSTHEIEENSQDNVEENILSNQIEDVSKRLGDKKTEKENFDEIEQGLYDDGDDDEKVIEPRLEEVSRTLGIDDEESEPRGDKEEEGLLDDWEGVESTELEMLFGAAVVFVGSKGNAGLIDRDMKIKLYGLHKISIEGPCRGAQPMALNVSARAKWVSWKTLGNMSRELAMEQYILALSERVPGWMSSNIQAGKLMRE